MVTAETSAVLTPATVINAGINIFVTVVFVLCGVFLLSMIAVLFFSKGCKIFYKGGPDYQERILESSSEEDLEQNPPLTPRRITRTASDRGREMKIEDEIEMHDIRQAGKKENTVPSIKLQPFGESFIEKNHN